MSEQSRMEILGRLRGRQRASEPTLPVWRSQRQFEDLAARFEASALAAGTEVVRADDADEAIQRLGELLMSLEVERGVVNGDANLEGLGITGRFPQITFHNVTTSPQSDLREACIHAEVGISGASAALAETGTIIVASGQKRSRLATLLPPVHIALLPKSVLTADLLTWAARRINPPAAHVMLISGPSKSADIGMKLAVGVHGPKRFIVILYDD